MARLQDVWQLLFSAWLATWGSLSLASSCSQALQQVVCGSLALGTGCSNCLAVAGRLQVLLAGHRPSDKGAMHPVPVQLSPAPRFRSPSLLMQAIFNFMSCSAVAMAKMYGGSNALLVTGLIMVAHMVSCPGSFDRQQAHSCLLWRTATFRDYCGAPTLHTGLPLGLHNDCHQRLCMHSVYPVWQVSFQCAAHHCTAEHRPQSGRPVCCAQHSRPAGSTALHAAVQKVLCMPHAPVHCTVHMPASTPTWAAQQSPYLVEHTLQ